VFVLFLVILGAIAPAGAWRARGALTLSLALPLLALLLLRGP
jgi:hypothetical protein